ncbi:hypothetical protein CEXT_30211 [Caerostris extrusa]|uniref:Uncharacterized protein n=1 Tax=Caerostris extrusa TaxID=172846 RepID=A0AAV4WQR9_CAEEX|nr:hypothetical protein CEXT_30211 [Caerostris extrusa]
MPLTKNIPASKRFDESRKSQNAERNSFMSAFLSEENIAFPTAKVTSLDEFPNDSDVTSHYCRNRDCRSNYIKEDLVEIEGGINCISEVHKNSKRERISNFLSKLLVKHDRTSTSTVQQNSVKEKFNRCAVFRVRTTLQDNGLRPRFWAEAVSFIHIRSYGHKLIEGVMDRINGGFEGS